MSHIEGHIDDPPQSCGKLHLVSDGKKIKIDFVPPPFIITKDTRVGFHPIYKDSSHKEVLAVDIVLWEDHEAAEATAKVLLNSSFEKIEEIHGKGSLKGQVEALLVTSNMPDRHKDVIRKTLDYFKQKDFVSFYEHQGTYDSDIATQRIIKLIGGTPLP